MRPPRKLIAEWYRKLKEAGFKDIEDSNGNLKDFHSKRFLSDINQHVAKQRYFELARQLYHSFKFRSSLDKTVWGMHSEGLSAEEISRRVQKGSEQVSRIINDLGRLIKTDE